MIDVSKAEEVVRFFAETHAAIAALAARVGALEADLGEHTRVLNDVVIALNKLIDSYAAAPAPAPAIAVPAAPAAPPLAALAAAASGKMNVASIVPALLAKNPDLQRKLSGLSPCAKHATFSMTCGDCQQSAIATLAGVG